MDLYVDREVLRCLNYKCLVPLLCERGVLTREECAFYFGDRVKEGPLAPTKGVNECLADQRLETEIVNRLKSRPNAFVECLKKEPEHLGHEYVAALMENRPFSSESELADSEKWKQRLLRNQTLLMDVNVRALTPYLMRHRLLTISEAEALDSKPSENEKVLYLLNFVLETKGPTAHLLFANCLKEEPSHPTHRELYRTLVMEDEEGFSVQQSGRKRSLAVASHASPVMPKRFFYPPEMEKPLKGKRYSRMMCMFQTSHHTANWERLEEEAQRYISGDKPQLKVAALLEMAISFTFRGMSEEVDRYVKSARSLLHKVTGNNLRFLEGRCEHVLSCRYRYSKDFDKAREHTHKAKAILCGSDPGEDSSWAHYCDACVLLEQYSQSKVKDEQTLRELKRSFQLAIDHTEQHNTGMDVVKPHSHIRLAQLCLGSEQYVAGITEDKEMINEAEFHLKAVDVDSLKQRSKSLYYIFKSDLNLNLKDSDKALRCAERALELAKPNYTVEIRSAEERIKAIKLTMACGSDPSEAVNLCSQ